MGMRLMDNDELTLTIYEFLKYMTACKISPMIVNVNPTDPRNLLAIDNWVNEVWAKEKL